MSDFLLIVEISIGLLLIAALVGVVTRQLRVPYTVGLVLIGLALSLRGKMNIEVPPELFLGLLVPPLIFEAAFHLSINDLRRDMAPILMLAIPGVLITTFLVGAVITWGTGIPFPLALVFGALVAATDPVAVVALFRSLGVPKRLQVLLEGESLFNDGTAIVIFHLMLVIAVSGHFSLTESLLDFVVVAGGGLVVGLILGILISQAISRIDDPLIETALTTVLAFGAYLVAEELHVSGVLAVVAAGLVSGNIGPRGMSPSTRMLVYNFWDYAAFLANSFVFLLIGMQIDLLILVANWQVIGWAILAVLIARAVGVYGLSWIGPGIPRRFKHILYWGGLRGAISLALAMSLPAALGTARDEIQAMTFGVVLFTLLVQGLTMKPLVQHMQLIQRSKAQDEYEGRHGRAVMARASYERLKNMYHEGLLSTHVWEILSTPLKQHAQGMADAVTETLHASPDLETNVIDTAIRELLQTQRNSLTALMRDNIISEEIFSRLLGEVDKALTEPRTNMIELLRHRTSDPVRKLMAAVVQERDIENTISVLNRLGLPATRLSSTGGFLGGKNVTLLIGIPEGYESMVIRAINEGSQQRTGFLTASDEGNQTAISKPAYITVKGAIIFTFEVERYEEL
ncbi:MAG: Na+/H+ antiporter [Chloroflexi bacterium]|nr:Na+/H+ antiporter [Chloroflexota bacterium]MBU1662687.1 Na+/H+ antiporter [Chloroflexota bacterium]